MQQYVVFITCEHADFSHNFVDSSMFCSSFEECRQYAAQELRKLREYYGSGVLCDAFVYKLCGETLS